MEVITLQSEAFLSIIKQLEEIALIMKQERQKNPLKNVWLDNQEVCQLLHISKRTLQTLRHKGKISYSKDDGRIYYRAEDVQQYLDKGYMTGKTQS